MSRSLLAAVLLSLVVGTAEGRQRPTTAVPALPSASEAELSTGSGFSAETPSTGGRAPLKIGGGGVRVGDAADAPRDARGSSVWGVLGALALTLGLFAALAKWFAGSRATGSAVGGGACEVLARVKLEPRASMHVVRIGGRVILVGSAADGLTALGEINDPVEAEALAASCRVSKPNPLSRVAGRNAGRESFRTLFGRAAAAETATPEVAEREPREPDVSDAERRLAARLRPAGATR
ncbi:flagellar biosynthetic protein FliO [Alienimonas chondri]|uniref:Flagellar protein n=1 Tax=Alienimonas chondri TaxID=2681879 RepID=A0ABX1VHU1_9PLAN|nr:flagellar biosynthetic protein FliO [Alienimonas chondri]NNJ27656.1 hypothetical protein [Alienimonas chondri]